MESSSISTSATKELKFTGESQKRTFIEILKRRSCVRCALRLIGLKDVPLYRMASYRDIIAPFIPTLSPLIYDDPGHIFCTETSPEPHLCQLCMGILQHCDKGDFPQKLIDALKNTHYERVDYKLKVKLPRMLTLTQYHVVYEISIAFPSLFNYLHQLEKQAIPGKDIFKWIMAPFINKGAGLPVNMKGEFFLCVAIVYPPEIPLAARKKREKKLHKPTADEELCNKKLVDAIKLLQANNYVKLKMNEKLPLENVLKEEYLNLKCKHENTYLYGSYTKESREISQVRWMVEEKRKGISSIQEELFNSLKDAIGISSCLFHAGGREDIDVRMLGAGRPFLLECVDPTKMVSAKDNEEKLGEHVAKYSEYIKVHSTRFVDKSYFEVLKNMETDKIKEYRCVVWCERKIEEADMNKLNEMVNVKVYQKTPIRVLHRRSLRTREKQIYGMKCEKLNDHFFILDVLSSAGTYIKEFVHGDLGRTMPNVGSLLNSECDILQLDVANLHTSVDLALASFKAAPKKQ